MDNMKHTNLKENDLVYDPHRDESGVVVEKANQHVTVRMIDGVCKNGYVMYRKESMNRLEVKEGYLK